MQCHVPFFAFLFFDNETVYKVLLLRIIKKFSLLLALLP